MVGVLTDLNDSRLIASDRNMVEAVRRRLLRRVWLSPMMCSRDAERCGWRSGKSTVQLHCLEDC
jgi:hypothetical protein